MSLLRFLKYERPYLLLHASGVLMMAAVFYADSRTGWDWETFGYSLMLQALMLACFFMYRYMKTIGAVKRMRDEDSEPLSLEAEACHAALEQLEREHLHALNDIQARQNEYYDFIVSWFHEIKTPIAVLRLMQQTEIDSKSLDEEISRVEHYVDQALYYAKLDSFNQDYEIVNCDLQALMKEVVKRHSKTFIFKKIRIKLEMEPTDVQSDPKWLQFILNQLVTNSLKYTGEQGEITVSARVTPQEKLLIVRDSGIGIADKDVQRIFNRGFTGTAGRTQTHAKSTGMGLYLAQQLSNKLGHYITCESEAGRFTEMTVHFPRNHDPFLQLLKGRAEH